MIWETIYLIVHLFFIKTLKCKCDDNQARMKCNNKRSTSKNISKPSTPFSSYSTLKIRALDPFGAININRLKHDFTSLNTQDTNSPEKWDKCDSITKTPKRFTSSGSIPHFLVKRENFDSGFKESDLEHDFDVIQRSSSSVCGSAIFASNSKTLMKKRKKIGRVQERKSKVGFKKSQQNSNFGNIRSSESAPLPDDRHGQVLKNLDDASSNDSLPDVAKPMDYFQFSDSRERAFIPSVENVLEGSGEGAWTNVSKCSRLLPTAHEMKLKEELRDLFNGCIPDEDDKVSVETLLLSLEMKIGERLSSVVPSIKTKLLASGRTTDFDAFLSTIYQLSESLPPDEEISEPATPPPSSPSFCVDFGHDLDHFRRSTLLPKSRQSDYDVSLRRSPITDDIPDTSLKSPGNEAVNICDYTYGTIETDFNDSTPNASELQAEIFELKHLNAKLLEDNQRITAIYNKAEADHASLQDECQDLKNKLEAGRVKLDNIPALQEENLRLRAEINHEAELYLDLRANYKQCYQENDSLAKTVARLRQELTIESEKLVMVLQEKDTRIADYRQQIRQLEKRIGDSNDQLACLLTKKKQHEEVIRRSDDVIQRLQEENVSLRDELYQMQTSQQSQNVCKSIAAEMMLSDVSLNTTNPLITLSPKFNHTMPFSPLLNIHDEIISLDVSDRSLPFCENNTDVEGSSSHSMVPALQKSNRCHALIDNRELATDDIAPKFVELQHCIMLMSYSNELREIEERWNGYARLVICNVFGQLKVSTPPGSPASSPPSEMNQSPIWDSTERSLSEIFEVVCEQRCFQELLDFAPDEEGDNPLVSIEPRNHIEPWFQIGLPSERPRDEHSQLKMTGPRIEITSPTFSRRHLQMGFETDMRECEIAKVISPKKELPHRLSSVVEAPLRHQALKSVILLLFFFIFLLLVGSLSILYMIMTHLLQACPPTSCCLESLSLIPVIEITRAGTPPI